MPGGETEKDISAWTVDSLKEHIESKLELIQQHFEARIDNFEKRLLERAESQERSIEQVRDETARALAAADKAILKSEAAAEKRFESVNEFRAQLADQANTFQRADAATLEATALKDRLDKAEKYIAEERGRGTGEKDTAAEVRAREAEERARKAEDGRRVLLLISVAGFIITVILFANGVFK